MQKTHCLRGHEYIKENTRWSIGNSGKPQRSCKQCNSIRVKLKYKNDKAFREKKKAYSKEYKCTNNPNQ